MKEMEARIIIEDTGNYDEEDTEYILETYNELLKHVGWADERRDKRFIVKFHDIFYYMPDGIEEAHIDGIFDIFCEDMYTLVSEEMNIEEIDEDLMIHPMCVGHYQPFIVNIEEINEDDALGLAMDIYDEVEDRAKEYVESYIKLVDILQDIENNYMKYWIDFLEDNEFIEKKYIEQIKEDYKKDMERRNAKYTPAK